MLKIYLINLENRSMCFLDGIVKVKLQVQAGLTSVYLCSHCISSLFLVKVWRVMKWIWRGKREGHQSELQNESILYHFQGTVFSSCSTLKPSVYTKLVKTLQQFWLAYAKGNSSGSLGAECVELLSHLTHWNWLHYLSRMEMHRCIQWREGENYCI